MPVHAFPGERNWGYDGTLAFDCHLGIRGWLSVYGAQPNGRAVRTAMRHQLRDLNRQLQAGWERVAPRSLVGSGLVIELN